MAYLLRYPSLPVRPGWVLRGSRARDPLPVISVSLPRQLVRSVRCQLPAAPRSHPRATLLNLCWLHFASAFIHQALTVWLLLSWHPQSDWYLQPPYCPTGWHPAPCLVQKKCLTHMCEWRVGHPLRSPRSSSPLPTRSRSYSIPSMPYMQVSFPSLAMNLA